MVFFWRKKASWAVIAIVVTAVAVLPIWHVLAAQMAAYGDSAYSENAISADASLDTEFLKFSAYDQRREAVLLKPGDDAGEVLSAVRATNLLCERTAPYPMAPELAEAMLVVKRGPLAQEPWKYLLPVQQFENCLNIQFTYDPEEKTPGMMAAFQISQSNLDDLRIVVSSEYGQSGDALLGATLIHEITHVWQYVQARQRELGNPAFGDYLSPDCYEAEAQAHWMELVYVEQLMEEDGKELNRLLQDVTRLSSEVKPGAYDIWYLVEFAKQNQTAMQSDPVGVVREHYVKQHDGYLRQCNRQALSAS